MGKNIQIIEAKAKGFKKSEKKVKGLNKAMGGLAKKAMGVAAVYFGASGILNALKSSMTLYAEQQLAEVKLEAALGKTATGLKKYASALQKTTRFGDELILQGMAQLAFFIKDEEQLKIATAATLDLASAKGMDLVQAADLVAKSVGSSTNALSRYGIAAVGAVGSQERLLSITNEIENLFGGQAVATTDSYQGAIDQLSNAFGDMQEKVGQTLAPTIRNLAEGFTALISESMSDSIDKDRVSMENLFIVLKNTNISTKLRAETIENINTKYGSYLPNLLSEKSTLEDIKRAHDSISTALIQQLALEVNREAIAVSLKEEMELRRQEKKLVLEQGVSHAKLNQAYIDQSAAQKELNNTSIEGIDVQGRYKDDTAEFEKALVSETSAYTALGYGVASATKANAEATDAVNINKKAQDDNRQSVINLNLEAQNLAATYVGLNKEAGDITPVGGGGVSPTGSSDSDLSAAQSRYEAFLNTQKESFMTTEIEKQLFHTELEQVKLEADLEALNLSEAEKDAIITFYDNKRKEMEEESDANIKKSDDKLVLDKTKNAQAMTNIATQSAVDIASALGANAKDMMNINIAQSLADTYAAANVALKSYPPPVNFGMAAAVVVAGLANVRQINQSYKQQHGQYGYEGVVSEPTQFTVGEGGASEYVSVQPMEGVNNAGGQGININISGNVMSEQFVEEELSEKISEAVRKGVDFGMS